MGFLCGSASKESGCNAGDLGSIPGLGNAKQNLQQIHILKRKSNPSTTQKTVIQPQEKKGEKRMEEKTYGNKPQTIKKMATGTYTLIITLNINRLKALTKRHKMTIDKENHIHTYAVYKRPRDTY